MDAFEGKNKRYRKQLTKLSGNKVLRGRPRAAMFVVSFANFKSRSLSRVKSFLFRNEFVRALELQKQASFCMIRQSLDLNCLSQLNAIARILHITNQ